MAIVYIREDWEGREGTRGAFGENSATRVYFAETNNKNDTEQDLLDSGLLPIPFVSFLPENPLLLCRNVTCTNLEEEPYLWDIEVEYSDERLTEEEQEQGQQPNPLLRPLGIQWNAVQYEKALIWDKDGNAIMNSAKDPYDPPPTMDDSRWVISVSLNVPAVPTFVLTLNNAINSGAVTVDGVGFAAKTLKVSGISIGPETSESGIVYRQFSYQLHYRSDTWILRIADTGFQRVGAIAGTKFPIELEGGGQPSTPQFLNGSGGVLENPTPETVVFEDYDVYDEADLSVLPGVF